MISSLLVMKDVPPPFGEARGVFVLLHGRTGDVSQLLPLAAEICPDFRCIAAEGPRQVTAYTVEKADTFAGYEWFPAKDGEVQELARFGHALATLEQLVVDVLREFRDLPVFLIGMDQGGSMVLALASIMPEYLAGAVSIEGPIPVEETWSLEPRELGGIPLLLLDRGNSLAANSAELREQGADVTLADVADLGNKALASAICPWLQRCLSPANDSFIRSSM